MAESRYEYLLDKLLGTKLRTKETGTTGKNVITDWTPNNIKTFIVTPNSVIVEYHVINDKTKKHPAVNKKVFTIDMKSIAQNAQSKSVLKILTEPRVLSGVEEIILLMPQQTTQANNMSNDIAVLQTLVNELKVQIKNKNPLRFPRLHYVTIVNAPLSTITALTGACSNTRVVFTEALRKNKTNIKVIYENVDWWRYGITGFAPLRPEYYALDVHPELGANEQNVTDDMVLHKCFTNVAKPYIQTQMLTESAERAVKEFKKEAESYAQDIPYIVPLLTEAVARNAGITCLSACVANTWKDHDLYKEYVFNKLLLSRKHINTLMKRAEDMLLAPKVVKESANFKGLDALKLPTEHKHVYKRAAALNAVTKIAQYAYMESVPKQLQELSTLFTYAPLGGVGALCVYVGWISGISAITTEIQSAACDKLARMTYNNITVNMQKNIAESLDTPANKPDVPTTDELSDFYILAKAVLYTMHYLMFELQAEFVIDRRCGSPEDIAIALRRVQTTPGNVPASVEVARMTKGCTLYGFKDKALLYDEALIKGLKNVRKRGITDHAQVALLACGIDAYIYKTRLGISDEDIVPCYMHIAYKDMKPDVQAVYNAVYMEIAKVFARTDIAREYVDAYNLQQNQQ